MNITTEEEYKKMMVAKVKCLKSLLFHYRFFFMAREKKKAHIADHVLIIIEALERVLTGKCKRLIINIAPRYFKTDIAVKAFIAHALSLNNMAKFIHLSYGDDIALDNSESVKDTIQSDEYQFMFPEVQIKKDSKAKDKWYTTAGGGVLARSAAGQVTGFGAGRTQSADEYKLELEREAQEFEEFMTVQQDDADPLEAKWKFSGAIIIDDPIKPDDADSDTIRNRVNERFDSTIRNRVNSKDTPIIVIMQRLHEQDLSGYLMREDEADEWEVISLPAIKEDGTALCPFKHTIEQLKALEKANDIIFQRQYMQNPKPRAGLLFPIQDLKFFNYKKMEEALGDPDFCFVAADPADEGGDDFAAPVCKLIGDKIYVTQFLYNTDGADHNEIALRDMVIKSKAAACNVEGVLGWKETADRVREDLVDNDWEGEFRIVKPRKNKHSRILNRASFIRNHFVFRDDWEKYPQYAKAMRNLTSYLRIQEAGKSNKHDDAPDVLEMCGSYFEKNFAHLW